MARGLGSKSNKRKSPRTWWYGKKAIALYAVIGLAVMVMAWRLPIDNGFSRVSDQYFNEESTAQIEAASAVAERERVLVGDTVAELRSMNNVRALRYEEQTMALNRLRGVWGVGMARVIEDNSRVGDELLQGVTLQDDPEGWLGVVEIHKTVEGEVSVIGFVEEGSVVRLLDESREAGSVYFYHEAVREGLVPVAIPTSRIVAWDYREPHEFSEIVIDEQGG